MKKFLISIATAAQILSLASIGLAADGATLYGTYPKGGMGQLKTLTQDQVNAIAKTLASGTSGSGTFSDPACAQCHYSDGKVIPGSGPMPGGEPEEDD